MAKVGVLLINLGSPDHADTPSVRSYLREFLRDPRVIDIPAIFRWPLVYFYISIFRAPKSAHAYQKIWLKEGSPLVQASLELGKKVQELLGADFAVEVAMRYGNPSIPAAVERLLAQRVEALRVLPLYPHYASASTGSSLELLLQDLSRRQVVLPLRVLPDFYEDPRFIQAFAAIARPLLAQFKQDYLLYSYHGLPERQLKKCDPTGHHCFQSPSCCDQIGPNNRFCYRAQCVATTRALQKAMGISPERSSLAFQSRLGRTPWIKPYTDEVLAELYAKGVRRLAVMCPAFVADCLETLEEIALRCAEDWKNLGGEDFLMVPSLNAEDVWCEAVAAMIKE